MMVDLTTTNFLNEIGQLGKKTSLVLPDNVLKEWQPTGSSLEEINARRAEIRKLAQEYNQKDTATNVYMDGSTTGTSTMLAVGENKKVFITAITLSAFNVKAGFSTSIGARVGLEIYSSTGTAVSSLGRISLVPVNGNESISLSFPYPIVVNQNETLRIGFTTDTEGMATATAWGWEEDI